MIELLTSETPNGWKVSIALEEMGLPYTWRHIKLSQREQKEDWYLALNPNGRIPTIIDHDEADFVVFESGAILLYLAEKSGMLLPRDRKGRSCVMQWLMFQMSGIGPMMGQANVFLRYAPEKIPYAIERYQREVLRLFGVLDRQLADSDYVAGEYSIADIALWPWINGHDWSGVSLDEFANLRRWHIRIKDRPAVTRGLAIPPPVDLGSRTQATVDAGRKFLV